MNSLAKLVVVPQTSMFEQSSKESKNYSQRQTSTTIAYNEWMNV